MNGCMFWLSSLSRSYEISQSKIKVITWTHLRFLEGILLLKLETFKPKGNEWERMPKILFKANFFPKYRHVFSYKCVTVTCCFSGAYVNGLLIFTLNIYLWSLGFFKKHFAKFCLWSNSKAELWKANSYNVKHTV